MDIRHGGAPFSARTRIGHFSGEVHLVTGATGFVGAALSLELLRAGYGVVAMVRPGEEGEEVRFMTALRHAAHVYGSELDLSALDRVYAVSGDLLEQGGGVELRGLSRVRQIWHCAASLRYENRYQDEIRSTNVRGTGHIVDLAQRLGVETFNYVSTAYVAGRREGTILEEPPGEQDTNNHYERSKIDAERLVSSTSMRVRIFRPSVVVGHSSTLAATAFSGFYGFLRQLRQFRGIADRTQKGLLERRPLKIRADPEVRINLVPIDRVASETVRIGLSDVGNGIFHITHRAPPQVGDTIRTMFSELGLCEPEFVSDAGALEWLDARFDDRLSFYGSYIRGRKTFDRTRTDAALGGSIESEVVYDAGMLRAMSRWYLDKLELERTGMPAAR
jgi:nucleoside-diphosphate-sugar epimerase